MTGHTESCSEQPGSQLRVWIWVAAALILLLPAIAMPFTDAVSWTVSDFAFASVLLFGSLGAYDFAARRVAITAYRAGAGLAIAGVFLLAWINGAVGLTDSAADGLYLGVVAVGLIGALVARLRPKGMAYAMGATALAQALVGPIALVAGIVPAYNSTFEILGLTGFFVALFAGSAWLFWEAANGRTGQGAA